MNRNKEILRAATDQLDELGITYTVQQNKHMKIKWSCVGRNRTYTMPVSSSDVRVKHHVKSGVRKMLREDLGL
jgi:hypothetical protein